MEHCPFLAHSQIWHLSQNTTWLFRIFIKQKQKQILKNSKYAFSKLSQREESQRLIGWARTKLRSQFSANMPKTFRQRKVILWRMILRHMKHQKSSSGSSMIQNKPIYGILVQESLKSSELKKDIVLGCCVKTIHLSSQRKPSRELQKSSNGSRRGWMATSPRVHLTNPQMTDMSRSSLDLQIQRSTPSALFLEESLLKKSSRFW